MDGNLCNTPEGRVAKRNLLTRISDTMATAYVLLVYQPGSRSDVRWWRVSRRPWAGIRRGRSIGDPRRRLRVVALRRSTAARPGLVRHYLHVYTRLDGLRRSLSGNVVALPPTRRSATADFLRYHVLVRVFNGDADRWLAHLRRQGDFSDDDIRFVRWIRGRLRREPELMNDIRKMVERTPLWA
jgi:hypothetical protein